MTNIGDVYEIIDLILLYSDLATLLTYSLISKQFNYFSKRHLRKNITNAKKYNKDIWWLYFNGGIKCNNNYNYDENNNHIDDFIFNIFLWCEPKELFILAKVSKQFNRISRTPIILKNLITQHNGNDNLNQIVKVLYHNNYKVIYKRYHNIFIKNNITYTTNTPNAQQYFNNIFDEQQMKDVLGIIFTMMFPRFTNINNLYRASIDTYDVPILILYGRGNSGITTFKRLLDKFISNKWVTSRNGILDTNQINLKNINLLHIAETESNSRSTNLKYVNQIVCNELVKYRKIWKKEEWYVPHCRVMIECNQLPTIPDNMKHKVKIINFNNNLGNFRHNSQFINEIMSKYLGEVVSLVLDSADL